MLGKEGFRLSLRIVAGRAGTGKTEFCLKEISDFQNNKNDYKLIYIVPEQFSLQAERSLIDKTEGKGIMGAQVLSFQRLAFNLFSENGRDSRKVLGDIGKAMAIRKIIFENSRKLEYFKNLADKQGFLHNLSATLSEFFQYNIDEEKLLNICESFDEGSLSRVKLNDLYLILVGYKKFLSKEYISKEETLDIVLDKVENSAFLSDSFVWIDGFYGFTPQEYNIIEKLIGICKEVTICLTIDEKSYYNNNITSFSAFYETNYTVKKLLNICMNCSYKVNLPVFLKEPMRFKCDELIELEKNYFSYTYSSKKECENIRIFSAPNKYFEIEDTAKQILALVSNEGYRFKDIAIVSGDLGNYKKIISGILSEQNIPFFIDSKIEIISHPLIELIRSLLDIVIHNFSYESVFRFLKTGLSSVEFESINIMENYILEYGMKGYKSYYDEWVYGLDEDEEVKFILNSIRSRFLNDVSSFYEKMKKDRKHKVKNITEEVYNVLEKLNITDKLSVSAIEFEKGNIFNNVNSNVQVWNKMIEIFDKISSILGEEDISVNEYAKILEAGFMEGDIGIIPSGTDRVTIGDIERTRLPKIKALFIVGVNDGLIPKLKEDESVFTEYERQEINDYGVEMAHSGSRKVFEDQFLIYCGITKPENKIQFSYSTGDLGGKTLRPSILISKIKKIFPLLKECFYDEEIKDSLYSISSGTSALHEIGQKLREYIEGDEVPNEWLDVLSYMTINDSRKINNIFSGLKITYGEEMLRKELVKKIYKNGIAASVSKLENFASCPYSFFLRYNLNIKERKIYQISTPDMGIVLHEVLDKFFVYVKSKNISWKELSKENIGTIIKEIVDKTVPDMKNRVFLSSAANKYLVKRLERISNRTAWALTEHIKKGKFEPAEFEMGFGKNEKLPPIIIELSDGTKMMMNGKIDRIDIFTNDGKSYIKIIDYKSGKKTFSLKEIYYGVQLQLMLYMWGIINNPQMVSNNTLMPGGAFYFHITDPLVKFDEKSDFFDIEKLILKEMKMSGLVLKDENIIKAIDSSFPEASSIIPVGLNKNGSYKKESSTATLEDFEKIVEYSYGKAKELGEEIINGNINIKPYKDNKNSPCQYCAYKSVCSFEGKKKSDFNILKDFGKEEILEKIINKTENV